MCNVDGSFLMIFDFLIKTHDYAIIVESYAIIV